MKNKNEDSIHRQVWTKVFFGSLWALFLFVFSLIDLNNPVGLIKRLFESNVSSEIHGINSISKFFIYFLLILFVLSLLLSIIAGNIKTYTPKNNKFVQFAYNSLSLMNIVPAVLMIFIFVDALFFSPVAVSGHSMENTLSDGDVLMTDHSQRIINNISDGDIIILELKDDSNKLIIKRVRAVEGDTISFIKSSMDEAILTVNGVDINTGRWSENYGEILEYKLKSGEYFVVGDHMTDSYDSRNKTRGIMTTNNQSEITAYTRVYICGVVIYSLKPFGGIPKESVLID